VTKVTISSRLLRLFHRDRSGKQDVVFKMNVLVQIRFEFRQDFVKRLITDACIGWSGVTATRLAHGPQCSTSGVMLMLHHRNRVLHAPKRWWQDRFILNDSLLHPDDVREQHHLFLHHVHGQFLRQPGKACANVQQFGMVFAVDRAHFLEQRTEAGNLLARVLVMGWEVSQ